METVFLQAKYSPGKNLSLHVCGRRASQGGLLGGDPSGTEQQVCVLLSKMAWDAMAGGNSIKTGGVISQQSYVNLLISSQNNATSETTVQMLEANAQRYLTIANDPTHPPTSTNVGAGDLVREPGDSWHVRRYNSLQVVKYDDTHRSHMLTERTSRGENAEGTDSDVEGEILVGPR